MGNIVNRVKHRESAGEELTTRYNGQHLSVTSNLCLGIYPCIRLEWAIDVKEKTKRATLMLFRNNTGFCPQDDPDDLTAHGQAIVETTEDGEVDEHLQEGTYYYTFLLRRPFLGFLEKRSRPLRFRETIPSAQVAISRMHDQLKVQSLLTQIALSDVRQQISEAEAQLRLIAIKKRLDELSKARDELRQTGSSKLEREADEILRSTWSGQKFLEKARSSQQYKELSEENKQKVDGYYRKRFDLNERDFHP